MSKLIAGIVFGTIALGITALGLWGRGDLAIASIFLLFILGGLAAGAFWMALHEGDK